MRRLVGEFQEQSFTQIIFPHKDSDWSAYLQEAQQCFIHIINTIIKYQPCLVVCDNIAEVEKYFQSNANLFFVHYQTDDTWARDCCALSVENNNTVELLDFTFNGWGEKFEASKDNAMSQALAHHYSAPMKSVDFILEGGGIESNAEGLLLCTSECMLNPNRNHTLSRKQITQRLTSYFGVHEVLYLHHGYLAGDDTDSHIDTLARFINKDTIMYVQCKDQNDEHFQELQMMQKELENFANTHKLQLIPLPMCSGVYFQGERLPATYANFLFLNGAVLVPVYNIKEDKEALRIFEESFEDRDVVAIDCSTLIKQHGSLHCVTMNFAKGVEII